MYYFCSRKQYKSDCKNSKIFKNQRMETRNTMEEKRTITSEEVQEAIHLLKTFAEQHNEDTALFAVLVSGPCIKLCCQGAKRSIADALGLYAMADENVKDIIVFAGAALEDDSKEGEKYRAVLKSVIDGSKEL